MTIARTLGAGLLLLASMTARANTAAPNMDFDALELKIHLINETPFPLRLVQNSWRAAQPRQHPDHTVPLESADTLENRTIAPGTTLTDAIIIGARDLEPDHPLEGELRFLVEGTDEAFAARYELVPPPDCHPEITALNVQTGQKYPLIHISSQNICQLRENSRFSGRLGHRITNYHDSTLRFEMDDPAIECINDSACTPESLDQARLRKSTRPPNTTDHPRREL